MLVQCNDMLWKNAYFPIQHESLDLVPLGMRKNLLMKLQKYLFYVSYIFQNGAKFDSQIMSLQNFNV